MPLQECHKFCRLMQAYFPSITIKEINTPCASIAFTGSPPGDFLRKNLGKNLGSFPSISILVGLTSHISIPPRLPIAIRIKIIIARNFMCT